MKQPRGTSGSIGIAALRFAHDVYQIVSPRTSQVHGM